MTIDERFERLEHFTAGWAEERRKDREEDRRLWRDTQEQLNILSRKVNDIAEAQARADDRFASYREEARERDRETDERIRALVSAIGEFMRKG